MATQVAFRCPDEVNELIEARQRATGQDKTKTLISMLRGLASLSINDRKRLPSTEAIYLVWTYNKLLYIGQTVNLKQRLAGHHRLVQFLEAEANVSWFEAANYDREDIEAQLIELLEPELNSSPVEGQKTWAVRMPTDLLEAIEARYGNDYKQSTLMIDGLWALLGGKPAQSQLGEKDLQQIVGDRLFTALQPVLERLNRLEQAATEHESADTGSLDEPVEVKPIDYFPEAEAAEDVQPIDYFPEAEDDEAAPPAETPATHPDKAIASLVKKLKADPKLKAAIAQGVAEELDVDQFGKYLKEQDYQNKYKDPYGEATINRFKKALAWLG